MARNAGTAAVGATARVRAGSPITIAVTIGAITILGTGGSFAILLTAGTPTDNPTRVGRGRTSTGTWRLLPAPP
jgi:hypothetical protein